MPNEPTSVGAMILSGFMRRNILLLLALSLSIAACAKEKERVAPDSPLASERKLLERQVASLREAVADAKVGKLFSEKAIAVGVSEEVVQSILSQALPVEKPVGTQFRARIERAFVSFRSMQGSVRLEGRVWAIADQNTFADLEVLGGIHEVEIDRDTGVLRAEIVLDGWDVRRAAAAGAEGEWIKDLVRLLGDRGLAALRDLVPGVRIPVGIEQGIDLPGVSGGPVVIPAGRLPLDAKVARILPLSGRLWAMVDVSTSGWEQAPPTTTPKSQAARKAAR